MNVGKKAMNGLKAISLLLLAGQVLSFGHLSWWPRCEVKSGGSAMFPLFGSSSANFALDPKGTEEEWMRRASNVDRAVFKLTEEGMQLMKKLNLEDANTAFDEVFKLKPNAYLWQAGIVKFYLDEFDKAADLFAKNAKVYESKFGGRASEERIWRHACELKMASLSKSSGHITKKELDEIRSALAPIPDRKVDTDSTFAETRKVVRIASDLFESTCNNDTGGIILSRAKLRSIGGNFDDLSKLDLKQWKLHSWFFLGLHYDALGETQESRECMQMAFQKTLQSGNGDDIVHILPIMHLNQRDWFDKDAKGTDPLELLQVSEPEAAISNIPSEEETVKLLSKADPLVYDSIKKSVAKMTLPEVEYALHIRGVKPVGDREELKQRLFESLMVDAGLIP